MPEERTKRTSPMAGNWNHSTTPNMIGLGIEIPPNASASHESGSAYAAQSPNSGQPSTPQSGSPVSVVEHHYVAPAAPMSHVHLASSAISTDFPSANLATSRLTGIQQPTNCVSQEQPTRPYLFMVFDIPHPELERRYGVVELEMLERMYELDRQIFLLFQLYGETRYSESLLRDRGIMLQYARDKYRECCRLMWRWHWTDKQALMQAVHQQEAQKFDTIAQLMVQNFKTNAWPKEVICTQWLKFERSPETYLSES